MDANVSKQRIPQELASSISIIGANVVFGSGIATHRRIIWALLIVTGLLITGALIQERFKTFLSHPITETLNIDDIRNLPFPTVTICSFHWWSTKWLAERNITNEAFFADLEERKNKVDEALRSSSPLDFVREMMDPSSDKVFITGRDKISMSESMGWDLLQPTLTNSNVSTCSFKNLENNCDDYLQVAITEAGGCMSFNPNQTLMTPGHGGYNGLSLMLEGSLVDHQTTVYSNSVGFHIAAHDAQSRPDMWGTGTRIGVGHVTDVYMKPTRFKLLSHQKRPCVSRQNIMSQTHTQAYSFDACLRQCESEFVFDHCKCRALFYPVEENDHLCSSMQQRVCSEVVYYYMKDNFKFQEQCNCLTDCEYVTYETTTSASEFSPAYFTTADNTTQAMHDSKHGHAHVNIFFSSPTFETIMQREAYTFWALMSDIGGALGLFVASALYTIVEFLDCCIQICTAHGVWKYRQSCAKQISSTDIEILAKSNTEEKREYQVSATHK